MFTPRLWASCSISCFILCLIEMSRDSTSGPIRFITSSKSFSVTCEMSVKNLNGLEDEVSISLAVADANFNEITFKNSKLFFATFRNCSFKNAKFVNCEIIYGTFYGGNLENTIFDNCVIDLTLFDKILCKNMKVTKSKLIWSAIFGSAASEIDTSSSSLLKFFTDISQVTEKDLEEAMNRMGPLVESLDISIKHKIKQEMEQDAQSLGVNMPKGTETHGYSAGTKNYSHPDLVY